MTAKTTRTMSPAPKLDKKMTAVKHTVSPVVAKPVKELPVDIAAMTCGAQGCKKPPVHAFAWGSEPEPAVKAHRDAYHAGTYRGTVSGFRSLLSMIGRGEEVAYGKRAKSKTEPKPKRAGSSPETAKGSRDRRLAKKNGGPLASGGEVRKSTPPAPPREPVARVQVVPVKPKVVATA